MIDLSAMTWEERDLVWSAARERTVATAIGVGLGRDEAVAIVDCMNHQTLWDFRRIRVELMYRTCEQLRAWLP